MEAIYRLNTSELGIGFVNAVKVAYPDQDVEIMVREQEYVSSDDDDEFDETEYLMQPPNGEYLLRAMKSEKLVAFETMEQLEEYGRERNTEKGPALLQAARERGAIVAAELAATK